LTIVIPENTFGKTVLLRSNIPHRHCLDLNQLSIGKQKEKKPFLFGKGKKIIQRTTIDFRPSSFIL
jgi:hypothetical protein